MIGSWMLSAMIFTALLGCAALCAESALRRGRRQARWVWLVALTTGAVWPILAPLLRRAAHESPAMLDVAIAMPSVQVVPDALPGLSVAHWIDVALLSLWALATTIAIARLIHATILLGRIRRAARPQVVDDVAVLITDDIGPAVIGVTRPAVLIPASLLALDRSLRRLALRHELEHSDAHDQVALGSSAIVLALVPWNLPLWWIVRRYRLAIEIDCDARVLADDGSARQYGQLLMLISQRARVPAFAPMLAASSSHLERRIAAMMPVSSKGQRVRIGAALTGAAVVAIAACSSRISDGIAGPKPEVAARATTPVNADQPWFEFQVNKLAQQIPGTGTLRYPDELRRANVEGVVLAQFVVDANGDVDASTFKALRSDNALFTDAVRSALANMKFHPAEVKGVRVKQLVQQPFTFSLHVDGASIGAPIQVSPPKKVAASVTGSLAHQIPGTGNIRYPDELRKANVEGVVVAQFVVDTNGRYSDRTFKVLSSTNPRFSEAVKNALPTMRFMPATIDGKPVRQLLEQPFTFSLSKQ